MTFDEYLYAHWLREKGMLSPTQEQTLREFEAMCRLVVAVLEESWHRH